MSGTILITGGAGFIGSALVRAALAGGDRVVTLDLLTYAGRREHLEGLDAARHQLVVGDIADRALVYRLLAEHRPRAIINAAAETHVDRSIDGPAAFVATNVLGTVSLLEAAREHWGGLEGQEAARFRFLQVSTDEVYGALGDEGAFDEQTPFRPNSPYAASKASADHFVRSYHRTYGLPTLISHCSNNYGPRQFPEKLIPLVLLNALEGKPLPIYGTGQNVRDWLFVDDHAAGLLACLERGAPGESYGFGGDNELTTLAVVEALCARLDEVRPRADGASYREQMAFVADRPGHDWRYAIDAAKAARELNWRPQVAWADGLARTVDWYLEREAWCAEVSRESYDRRRLGLGAGS